MSRGKMQNTIGNRLKILIKSLGLNLKEFSRKTGIPYPTLQDYLANKRVPGGENLQKISMQLNVNLNWLLTGEGEMFISKAKKPINIKDIPKENIKKWLDEFWAKATDEERAWLKIQFEKAFPEYKEWLLKKEYSDKDTALLQDNSA